ncbi:MAG: glycosyltransferase family 2 protein [Candidatus Paceibacteria bacterium]
MSKNKPLVSIIIPTYNRANFLPTTIKSAINQTYDNTEIIVVDDGSTDHTQEVVEKIQEKHPKIQYYWQENSGGAAKPKNKGIKKSKGKYIAILDSDDEYLPTKVEKQVEAFKHKDIEDLMAVGCGAKEVYIEKDEQREFIVPNYSNPLKELLKHDYMGSGSAMMYKRSLFDKVGFFDEKLKSGQDAEMRLRIATNGYKFYFIQQALIKYKIHKGNISQSISAANKTEDVQYIFNKYREYYLENPKILSIKLRYDGTRNMYLNNKSKARKKFLKSIKFNPLNIRSYLYLLVSFLGCKAYKKINELRHKVKKYF